MGMKQIKVSDETYNKLKARAEVEYRTLGGQIDFLLQDTFVAPKTSVPKIPHSPVEKVQTTLAPRGKGEVLTDIKSLEKERDEKLDYCQDREARFAISQEYGERINLLWEEYRELDGTA